MTTARRTPAHARRQREPNAAWEQLRRSMRPGAAGEAEYGAAGVTFFAPPGARIALFQLTTPLSYPDLSGAGSSHYTVEPTPCATARMVWCHHFDPEDKDAQGHPLRSYGGTANSRPETIYHPGVFRNGDGYAIGHPAFRAGDRVFCALNVQSGRWEILAPPLGVWRFELKTDLEPGGSAAAYLVGFTGQYEADTHVELTVHDSLLGTCRGRGQVDAIAGARGFAQYFPDADRWEILALEQQARWVRFQLTGDLSYANGTAAGHVLDYWDGYAPDPHDDDITLVNCAVTGQYLFAGQTGAVGLACLDPATGSYRIVQMECP